MHSSTDYEGLQVREAEKTSGAASNAPQFVPYSDKETVEKHNSPNHGLYDYSVAELASANSDSGRGPSRKKLICGLSLPVFITLIAVLVAVVVGAAVGGGVAGALAGRSRSPGASPTTTSQISSSTSATPTAPLVPSTFATASATSASPSASATSTGIGTDYCPKENGTTYTPAEPGTYTFTKICDVDWPVGLVAVNGSDVVDLSAVIANSMNECIDQCSAYNVANDGACTAVTYGANITLALSRGGIAGNCFLKSQRGETNVMDHSGLVESAYVSSS